MKSGDKDFNSILSKLQEFIWATEDKFIYSLIIKYYGDAYKNVEKCLELIKTEKIGFIGSAYDELKRVCYRTKNGHKELLGWVRFQVKKNIEVEYCVHDIPVKYPLKHKF